MTQEATGMRVVVFRDGEGWVAQCLEHDISAQGADFQSVIRRLAATVNAEIRYTTEKHGEALAGIDPAPDVFFRMFESVEQSLRADHMELRIAA